MMAAAELVERNMLALFRHLALARDSGETRELAGVTIASCGAAFHMFNAAFLSEPVANVVLLERSILTAAVHFAARRLRWAFWLWEHRLEEAARRQAGRVFSRHGLVVVSRLPGMIAEEIQPARRPRPQLEIRPVSAAGERADFCRLVALAFGLPLKFCREIYGPASVWQGGFAGFVGYVQGLPVTTAATMADGCSIGLYSVATAPGRERQGYAETIVRYALEQAASPGLPFVLQSTQAGLHLYHRMGFRTVTRVCPYSS
jgi:ribosomal protein S18 acetylase RimI-like enzyme